MLLLCDRALVHLCAAPVGISGVIGVPRDVAVGSAAPPSAGVVSATSMNAFTFFRALSSLDLPYWTRWFRVHHIEVLVGQGCSTFEELILDAVLKSCCKDGASKDPMTRLTVAASYALLQEVCVGCIIMRLYSHQCSLRRVAASGRAFWSPTSLSSGWWLLVAVAGAVSAGL